MLRDIDNEVAGRDVLLIDDILEFGKTLTFTRDLMLSRGAKSCSIAVLLDKRMRRQTELNADYVGFDCPDYFVVGYGMDVAHAFRELPFVGVVKGDVKLYDIQVMPVCNGGLLRFRCSRTKRRSARFSQSIVSTRPDRTRHTLERALISSWLCSGSGKVNFSPPNMPPWQSS